MKFSINDIEYEPVHRCIRKEELEKTFEKFVVAGEKDRNVTTLDVQGVYLNNVCIMRNEKGPDEYVLMWPSLELTEG